MAHAAGRILYLALADGRGHLMRADLLRQLLGEAGMAVDIFTTGREGVRFLEGLGTPSSLLSEHFRVEFGDRHDMSRARTDRRIFNYLVLPWRAMDDLRKLGLAARGADMVVNDSLHPALLLAPALGFPAPVVQLYGENLWRAMEDNFDHRAPPWASRRYRQALRSVRDRAFARIVHTLGDTAPEPRSPPRTFRLTPLVARPTRSPAAVRRRLGVPEGKPLAAIYLNPHFRDPLIAESVEQGLRGAGFHLHAVGEGYAPRPGWMRADGGFGDVVHAADLFLSGAGMGALELARSSGTPLLVLLGDQPEQARNVAERRQRAPDLAFQSVLVGDPDLGSTIAAAARALAGRVARPVRPATPESAWVEVFQGLLQLARQQAGAPLRFRTPPRRALGPGFP